MSESTFKTWQHHLIAPIGVALLFGVVSFLRTGSGYGALPTFFLPPLITVALVWLVMLPLTIGLSRALPSGRSPLLVRFGMAAAIGAFPLAILLPFSLKGLGFDLPGDQGDILTSMDFETAALTRYAKVLVFVFLVWSLVNYRWFQAWEGRSDEQGGPEAPVAPHPSGGRAAAEDAGPSPAPPPLPMEPPPAAFLDRMVKPIGREVWAIKAEQHYIRVFTAEGDEMILYRFGDALRDLAEHDGLQVHRSYWIAREAVIRIHQEGDGMEIELQNGLFVPVSRSFKANVKASGW